jgi:glutaredoxin/glutathione-dependent peroxiredoxin
MTIKVGDPIPDATLFESTQFGEACPLAPTKISVAAELKGKRVVIFGLPGAYTPTCSAQHVPGYVKHLADLQSKKIDQVWCVAVNDGFVMAAWGKELGAIGKVRMLGDGAAEFTRKLGLDVEIPGMGPRLKRCSLLVEDGVLKALNVEQPGKFEVSDAATMLKQLG